MAAAELLAEKSGATVNAAQDVDRILEAIARASLEGVGDVSLFDLLDDQGGTTRRMVASRNVHAVSAAAFEAFRSPLEPGHPLAAPLRAGQSCSASILDDEYIVRHLTESERRAAWRATEMGSIVVAPLQVFGRTLGALTVLRMQPNLPFDSSDTQVVEEIARRAAVAIDNIRVADGARKAAELHERHMLAFAKIGESLSESLGLRQTLDAALQIAVPEYADAGWITLAEGEGDLRLAAVSHTAPGASPSLERQVGNLYARAAQHHVGSIAAMRTREPVLYGEMTYELAAAMLDREIVDAVFECVAVSSVLIVPLIVDSLPRGTMVLCAARERGHRFEPADVPFFQELARRIAPAIGNAEAFERERRVARTFQRAALPAGLPNAAGYSFFAVYETGRSEALVGGDWYDAFCLSDGCIVLSIGDVAGSGLEAAVIMSNVRQTIRGVAQVQADPALMLASADSALREERPDRFVTAFVAVIDPISRSIDYASAGHPPPLLRMPDGTIVELDGARGLPLGLHDGYGGVATAHLPPASLLVLFTDGLVEATHDFAAGERRLRDAVASLDTSQVPDPARALRDRILDEAPRDDAAILVVQALERDAPSTWTINPREPRATNDARLQISRSLAVGGYAVELLPTAELIVAELVGNLARHAPGPAEISLEWNAGQPVLHVRDRGPGFDFVPKLPPDVYAESGRGLYLISALAREFAVARRPDGGSDVRVVLRS
jgi:GAF domain-containing protein/anti-sigma regulatory factor (Ser/Thr protein kinase)